MRIVLDTNCLLVIIPKQSKYRIVFDYIQQGKISLIISNDMLLEYEEKLISFYSKSVAYNIIRLLVELPKTEFINVYFNWLLITEDLDDNKFVDTSISGKADLIITNDHHFKHLNKTKFPKVKTMRLEEFTENIEKLIK